MQEEDLHQHIEYCQKSVREHSKWKDSGLLLGAGSWKYQNREQCVPKRSQLTELPQERPNLPGDNGTR